MNAFWDWNSAIDIYLGNTNAQQKDEIYRHYFCAIAHNCDRQHFDDDLNHINELIGYTSPNEVNLVKNK